MLRWSVVGLAVLLNLPGLYGALVEQTVDVDNVLIRLLITVPIVAVLLAFVRSSGRPSK